MRDASVAGSKSEVGRPPRLTWALFVSARPSTTKSSARARLRAAAPAPSAEAMRGSSTPSGARPASSPAGMPQVRSRRTTSPGSARREKSNITMPERPHGRKSTSPSSAKTGCPPRMSSARTRARRPSSSSSETLPSAGRAARGHSTGSPEPPVARITARGRMLPVCQFSLSDLAGHPDTSASLPGARTTPARRQRSSKTLRTLAACRDAG